MRSFIIGLALVTMLVGCTSPAEIPTAQTPAPSVTPSPTPEPATGPEPLLQIGCDDLATTAEVTALSTTAMAPADSMSRPYSHLNPFDFAIRHLQGLECWWDNGVPYSPAASEGSASLRVVILPDAEAEWADYTAVYGDQPGGCYPASTSECIWDTLTSNGAWVQIHFRNVRPEEARTDAGSPFVSLVDSILATVASAAEGARWSPSARLALPEPCGLLEAEVIGTALGLDLASVSMSDGYIGGPSLEYEAGTASGSNACLWNAPRIQQEYGCSVNSLVGGEWAWAESHAADTTAQTLALTGLSERDSAWLTAYSYYGSAHFVVDLIIGGNWISFSVPEEVLTVVGKDASALTIMAQGIVDRLS